MNRNENRDSYTRQDHFPTRVQARLVTTRRMMSCYIARHGPSTNPW